MGAFTATIRAGFALALANWAEKIASPGVLKRAGLNAVDDSRGWWPMSLLGNRHLGFQTDSILESNDNVIKQPTMFSCMTLIAADIGKLRAKLMEQVSGIWKEITSPAFSPVLRKPNRFQTWQKFIEQWVFSLLSNGNTYVLKERDNRQVVVAMYVLDPTRVRPLVAPDGSVYYAIQEDYLSGVTEYLEAVPASEIIHDRINCIFHPLVGLSPVFANALAATKALKIEQNAARFFANASQPGGILTAPAEISDETAARLKKYFEEKFTGDNAGKVAVLGDGLKYEAMTTNAVDAQLIEQLKWGAAQIAGVFHVPGYLVGAEPVPPNNNIEALRLDYYTRCLQTLIEGIENSLDDGLGLLGQTKDGKTLGIELDLRGLLRMDRKTQVEVLTKASGGAYMTPDEARAEDNLPSVTGGGVLYKQHQDYSLTALAKRDAKPDPFETGTKPADSTPPASDSGAIAEAAAAKATEALQVKFIAFEDQRTEQQRRYAEQDQKRAEDAARLAAEQAATVQRLIEAIPSVVAEAVSKAAPVPVTLESGDDDIEAFTAAFLKRMQLETAVA